MIFEWGTHVNIISAQSSRITASPARTASPAPTASPARTNWSFLLKRFLMNKPARWFVQKVVLVARIVASKSVGHPTHTVAELQRQIHEDLRRQHPEWIEPGGESPMCDFYEARLRRLLETCARSGPAEAA